MGKRKLHGMRLISERDVPSRRGVCTADTIPEKTRKEVVQRYLDNVRGDLQSEGRVRIPGIGVIRVKTKPARKARDAMIFGKPIHLKAKKEMKVVKLRVAKDLKEAVKRWK